MLEYIIIGLLIIVIVLLIILLSKINNNDDLTERLGHFEANIDKEIGDFKFGFSKDLHGDFDKLNDSLEKRLMLINDKVNERLDVNFEKTNKTFMNVLERLAKIDEAQKKIDGLSTEIVSLESILTDKKSRGIFGEVNLYHILSSIFGEKNDRIYKTQYTLSNTTIADAIVFGPEPLGTICIDSKFPLENYRRLVEKGLSETERVLRFKAFDSDVKKHIDAIADKYIIDKETTDQAIM